MKTSQMVGLVTPVQNDGMTYEAEKMQWRLIGEMNPSKKTVIYGVFVLATSHKYKKAGKYKVTLTETNKIGKSLKSQFVKVTK